MITMDYGIGLMIKEVLPYFLMGWLSCSVCMLYFVLAGKKRETCKAEALLRRADELVKDADDIPLFCPTIYNGEREIYVEGVKKGVRIVRDGILSHYRNL